MPGTAITERSVIDLRGWFLVLLGVVIMTFVLSYVFYNGSIDVMKEALSDLGAIETVECDCNTVSQVIFSSGMGVCAFIMAFVSIEYGKWRGLRYGGQMVNISRISSIGFALVLMPTDGVRAIHLVGVFLAVGGLWVLTIYMLHEVRRNTGRISFWVYHLLLDAAVLSYLVEGMIYIGSRTYFQKVAFFFLALIFFISLKKLYDNRSAAVTKSYNLR